MLKQRGKQGIYWIDIKRKGLPRIRTSTGTTDRKLAEEKHREVEVALLTGTLQKAGVRAPSDMMTLQEVFDELWSESWHTKRSAEHIHRNYLAVAEIVGRHTPIKAIDRLALGNVVRELRKQGNANGTINRKLAVLCKVLTYCCRDLRIIPSVPRIPRQEEADGRSRLITQAEEARVIALLRAGNPPHTPEHYPDVADLVAVLADTGCRLSEPLKLTWLDVDFDNRLLRLRGANVKNGDGRLQPMGERVYNIMRARLLLPPVLPGVPRSGPFDELNLAADGTLKPSTGADRAHRAWTWVRKEMGLASDEGFVIHALRHTCATSLLAISNDLRGVQVFLGHKTLAVTERYAKLVTGRTAQLADMLERAKGAPRLVSPAEREEG